MNTRNFLMIASLIFLFSACVSTKKYQELEAQEKSTQNKLSQCEKERASTKSSLDELSSDYETLKTKKDKLQEEANELSAQLEKAKESYAKLEGEYNNMQEQYKSQLKGKNLDIEKVREENLATQRELEKRSEELAEKERNFEQLRQEFIKKEQKLLELQSILDSKEKETQALKQKISDALLGFHNKGLTVDIKNGKVYVSMEEKLLFASGSWDVAAEGRKALKEVATVLEANPEINIVIEGHTDNLAYKGKNDVKDNWDLSVMRATSVTKVLLSEAKIAPNRISASGRGEYVPIAPNDSPANRAKNRRTEIILTPRLDELLNVLNN